MPAGDCLSRNGTVISGSRLESAVDDVGVVVLLARSEWEIGLKENGIGVTALHQNTEIPVGFL